jgi:S1-C subfamily serine protease
MTFQEPPSILTNGPNFFMDWNRNSNHGLRLAIITFMFVGSLVVSVETGWGQSPVLPTAVETGTNGDKTLFDIEPVQSRIYSAINRAFPAVVAVVDNGITFSGVIISSDGHIVSAGHTVEPAEEYKVILADGRVLRAYGLGTTPRIDCALLKIEGHVGLPHVELANSSKVVVDQPCLSIAHPGIYVASRGAVVRFGRVIKPISSNQGMIQSTALMEPGDSGGGLFDLDGKLLGVHSNIGQSLSRNFDVPANTYRKYWKELNNASEFRIKGIPSLPKLGIDVERNEDGDGLHVVSVSKDGVAENAGVEVGDLLLKLNDKKTNSIYRFQNLLMAARSSSKQRFSINVKRGDREGDFKIPIKLLFTKRIAVDGLPTTPSTAPEPIKALQDLSSEYDELESKLDDACVKVESELADERVSVFGTLIVNSNYIVSKNSRVGSDPKMMIDDSEVPIQVIARSVANDLVLLKSPSKNTNGIDLYQGESVPAVGQFLLTPRPTRDGLVSVRGSRVFQSVKRESKGFLGVMLGTADEGGAILERVFNGAARDAGLKRGDIIKQIDDLVISELGQLQQLLKLKEPNDVVVATVLRDDETIEREVRLGAKPPTVNHVAERMRKSNRRDGFSQVFSHDATLHPRECGGPVFDLNGSFAGINIARFSRVRCYVIPRSVIVNFVFQNSPRS